MRLAALTCVELFGNPALSWPDLALLREWTTLPIVLKGICHPEDARAALDAGMDGVIVSNHGGRQVDRSTAHAQRWTACPTWSPQSTVARRCCSTRGFGAART